MAATEMQPVALTIDELMYEHRVTWAAAVVGEGVLDLEAVDDPSAALDEAPAAVWLDGYSPAARDALVRAAERGAQLVVAVPASTDTGEDLARALPGATVVPQVPAGGSLIGAAQAGEVRLNEPGAREYAVWLLVCANVDVEEASARLGVAAGAQLAAQLARLSEAVEALREANVRLAREHLGRHDAAAGAVIGRAERHAQHWREQAEQWRARFEFEQELAIRHHEWFEAARNRLEEPHHRAAERVVAFARRIPGLRWLVKRLRGR
jgi:hypothetical protein